jgi:polyphosphate kinase
VELKARFDEQQNIDWATRLERAGAIVVFGIARLKVHAKALLIVRREAAGVRTYVHLGTGNYNDTTARLYTDLGLLTAREEIAHEATLFFNTITGYSSGTRFQRLAMAPTTLKRTILTYIEREAARADGGGLIMAKMNSLSEEEVIAALYAASRAGVTVLLNVRGVCLLRPRVAGLSENIRVVSIVDRFLEHSRIVYFRNGGAEQVYLASADWMPRNLERRVELMFPVEQPDLRRRLVQILELYFADNCHSYELQPDGRYRKRRPENRTAIHAQEALQRQARAAERKRVGPDAQEFAVRRRPPA